MSSTKNIKTPPFMQRTPEGDKVLQATVLRLNEAIDVGKGFMVHISYAHEGKVFHFNGRYNFPSPDMPMCSSSFGQFITEEKEKDDEEMSNDKSATKGKKAD